MPKKTERLISGSDSGREVIGNGRLQFYSAPNEKCVISGEFILPNEKVDARAEFGDYMSVEYTNVRRVYKPENRIKCERMGKVESTETKGLASLRINSPLAICAELKGQPAI